MDMSPEQRPFLGIIMLDTRFPRPAGDIGNPETLTRHGIAVRHLRVQGASPARVVIDADEGLISPFIEAAQQLAEQGAALISTSCGFLAAHQDTLAQAVAVPVISSSLLQCADLHQPGIVTINADSLTHKVLSGACVPPGTPIEGVTPGCEFHRRILNNETTMDLAEAQLNVQEAAMRLVRKHPQVRHIVLECTNMPPYRAAIAQATGRPIHDLETGLVQAWRAQFPR